MKKKKRILFFCKHNSCRSQMAEAFLKHRTGNRFDVFSAGLSPRPIHPLVYTVMDEAGIDIRKQTPKSIDLYLGREPLDEIIIVCQESEAECPRLYPFALHVERWPLPDPALEKNGSEAMLEVFRKTRDRIKENIKIWLMQHKEK
ncbi:MAG TPA: arsenate reductase ArsC [Phycisphaerales bacterium]|nr:arsenate reductase ArsC [Phycisphaerales bacterium]